MFTLFDRHRRQDIAKSVVLILGIPNPSPGAGWARVGFFAEHLALGGWRTTVIGVLSPRSLDHAGVRVWRGVKILNLCPTIWTGGVLSAVANSCSSTLFMVPLVWKLRPSAVILSLPPGEILIGAWAAAAVARAKLIVDYRDEWEDYEIEKSESVVRRSLYSALRTLASRIYRNSDLVITVTDPLVSSLISRAVPRVLLIPNGADLRDFQPRDKMRERHTLGLESDSFVAVYSGGIGGYSKLDPVIVSLSILSPQDRAKTKLLLMGAGPDLPRLMRLAQDLGVASNIVYLGVISDKGELARILSTADIGVVPYSSGTLWMHSLPAKFFEYCACSLPVVATAHGDSLLAKLIQQQDIGHVVSPSSAKQFAELFEQMIHGKGDLEAQGERARRLIVEHFNRQQGASELTRAIVTLLQT